MRHYSSILFSGLFLLFSGFVSLLQAAEPISLFHGKTLDDFDYFLSDNAAKTDVFSLAGDGVLKVTGNPFGWLGTKNEYTNFVLKVEYRYPDLNNTSNSGIFLRAHGNTGMFLPVCVEVQLAPDSMGHLFGFWDMKIGDNSGRCELNANHQMVKVLRTVKNFRNARLEDLSQWHTAEILCYGDFVAVYINGQLANWANGVETVPGKVAFQSEGAPIEFRNAELTVLD